MNLRAHAGNRAGARLNRILRTLAVSAAFLERVTKGANPQSSALRPIFSTACELFYAPLFATFGASPLMTDAQTGEVCKTWFFPYGPTFLRCVAYWKKGILLENRGARPRWRRLHLTSLALMPHSEYYRVIAC